MASQYRNPPIREAICEFYFENPISNELIKAIGESMKSDFPLHKHNNEPLTEYKVELKQGATVTTETVSPSIENQRFQWFSANRDMLFQIQGNVLTVNKLPPYHTFDSFYNNVEKVLLTYLNITGTKKIFRVGLRKVNYISFNGSDIPITDYFEWTMNLPYPNTLNNYAMKVSIAHDNQSRLELSLAPLLFGTLHGKTVFVFDLYYKKHGEVEADPTAIKTMFYEANSMVRKWFEGCLKDKLKQMFEPVN
jgi:uncharacterized protein (TIGR04255 family)